MVVSFLDLRSAIPTHTKQIGHVGPTSCASIRVTVSQAVHVELFVFLLYDTRYMNMETESQCNDLWSQFCAVFFFSKKW